MRIAILSTVNLKHMTIVSLYTEYLKQKGIPYDIIYIDKYGEEEKNEADNCYKFLLNIKREWNPLRKAFHYWKFRKFAKKILNRKNEYDFVICWNMLTTLMFGNYLSRKYKNKFCLNIRDIGTSNNALYNFLQRRAIKKCSFATVSSPAFTKFLPAKEYIFIQSLNTSMLNLCKPHNTLKAKDEVINITYIGYACYYENCIKLIKALCNDERFSLRFYGEGTLPIQEYAETIGARNVEIKGRFGVEQTPSLIQESDIIYNLYGNDNINLRTALSIKLYYAVFLHIPILVCDNTYMKEIADNLGIGITVTDINEDLGDYLFSKYHSFDQNVINQTCTEYIHDINLGNNRLYTVLDETIARLEG